MRKWTTPVCARCKTHKEGASSPPEANVLVLVAAVFTCGLALVAFYFYRKSVIDGAKNAVGPDCCSRPGAPVSYLRKTFTFHNEAYAQAFKNANGYRKPAQTGNENPDRSPTPGAVTLAGLKGKEVELAAAVVKRYCGCSPAEAKAVIEAVASGNAVAVDVTDLESFRAHAKSVGLIISG
jgi:hypothetical protein